MNLGGKRVATVGELLDFYSDSEQERLEATKKRPASKRTSKTQTKTDQLYKTSQIS